MIHLFYPHVPAEHKLLNVHTAIAGHIEDQEYLTQQGGVHLRRYSGKMDDKGDRDLTVRLRIY